MMTNLLFSQLTAMPKRLAMVLTVLFTLGVGSMLGAEVTFTASEDYSSFSGSPLSLTKAGVTVSGFGSVQSSDLRLYKGTTLNISSTNTISSIEFTFTNGSNNGGWNGTSSTYAVSGLSTKTWSKTATSGNSGKQARITKIIVKYESQAQQSYSVVLDRNGAQETINNVASGTPLDDIDGNGEQGGCAEWSFFGWSKSQRSDQDDSTPMDLVTEVDGAGPYYAVYSHTADDGGGSTTATMSSFSAVSGNVNNDANVSYAAAQGTASTAPGVYSNEIRIYQNGGTLTITGNNRKKLTSIIIGSSMKTSVSYKIDGGSKSSAQSITANGKYTLSDIDATSVLFTCEGTDKNSRLYLNYLSVTYSGGQTVYYTTTPDCKPQTQTYTITWKNADGTILETDNNVEYGATPQYNGATPTKAATAQYTYTFAGWDPEISTVTGDQIYTAKFTETLNKYTITWKNADGTILETDNNVEYGATPQYNGTTPTKAATEQYTYTHNGWTPSVVAVKGNAEYTATFAETPRTYKITLNTNGGTINSSEITEYTYGVGATLPTDITNGNLEFAGWYDNETCDGSPVTTISTTDTGNKEFWAKWEKATPTFAWSDATCTAALEADNTFPTLNNPNTLPVTYSSYDPSVATIDANGNITLVATGTTTITATGAETPTHKSATANYTLNVAAANCKWVETDIANINSGDEVVVTMTKEGYTYAMSNNRGTTIAPEAIVITVKDGIINQVVETCNQWTIVKDNNYLVFYADASNRLYGNKADDGLRVGSTNNATTNHQFIINDGYLFNIQSTRYVGVNISKYEWYSYQTNTGNIKDQTLKLYKKECLPANEYWVTWDANGGQWSDGSTKKIESYEVGAAITKPADPTREGYRFNGWTPTPGTMPAQNTTFTAQWAELHTITWMVGSNSVLTEEVANATGVTKTPDTPANGEIGECANAFRGWTETPLGSAEGQSVPADLCTAAQMKSKHSSVTGDKTFYAVFATSEETTGGTVEASLSFANTAQRTSLSDEQQVWTQNGVTLTNNRGTGSAIVDNSNPARFYKNSEIIVKHTSNAITKIVFDCNTNAYATALKNSIGTIQNGTLSVSSDIVTVSFASAVSSFSAKLTSDQVRMDQLTVTAGGGTITTYSNYVTNCCALAPVTNLTVSGTTANSATLTWTKPSSTTGITELQIRNTNDEVVVKDINPTTTTTATINELDECIKYNYYVVSVGEECEVSSETITAQPFSGAKTVNYDYNGGSGSPASFTTSCENQVIILPDASRPGYTFNGWYDAASGGNRVGGAGEEYNPTTSLITLYAQWTEGSYTLKHSGSNYTNTENKTTIKSSDTPFTLNYTCTSDYGFPSTITISGGGKSWTAGTDYVWTVAADKQSATLTINQTTISANVTITINMATRYTVTFEHNDKGVFDGESSIEVLSSENTITLPTVEDVSCGFYDTFEGWIVSNDEYVESTTKPATVYAGGASYKVTGDCTFRALYSKCEGDATQVYRKITSTAEVTDGTYILVANTATPLVYSGHTEGKDYGNCISGLTEDGSDFSNSLPDGAVPVTVSVGVSGFSIHNGTKFIVAGTATGVSDNASYWQLTDGSQVKSKACPQGVLQPINNTTYVLQKNNSLDRFKTYENSQSAYVFLYKLIDKCTKYYSTNPSCEKPVGVHIVYNANAVDASMSCTEQNKTYKVENDVNKYPQLASQLQFCTNATREGYTLAGWNTQANGQGTTYNINQNYYRLPVSGELDGDNWITLNLYAVWKQSVKFDLGNATGGTGVPDAVVENGECVLPEPTAEQLGTIPCAYEFYAWSETSVNATQSKPTVWMPGDTYTGSATTLYAVYRYAEGMGGSDTYYFTFNKSGKTYCITAKHNSYDRFVVAEQSTGLIFGLENGYLYYLDEGVKIFVYWEGDGTTTVTTTTTYPNNANQKTTFVEGDNGTTVVTPAISGRYLQMPSSYTDRAYYTNDGINPTLVEVQTTTCTYATNPTCYTNTNLHFVTNGGTLNYPTDYDERNYLELTPGTTILMPTATFAGEWTFEGWKRGSQLESQTLKPDDPSFYPVTLNTTQFEVDDVGDIYFYAVYSKTNDDKQFDPVNGGTYKLFAIGEDDTKTYMPIWSGGRGTPSGVTTCAEAGDYTIIPGTGTHAGQYQITCGEYTLGVQSDADTDLKEDEGIWWNIEQSTSGKGTWRITVVGSSNRALSALSNSFGNYSLTQINNAGQTQYRDMEIGECIYTEYTSTPENTPYITITGAPVKITSANGERVYASTTVHIEAHNFTGERIIHLSATNGFGVDPVQVRTNGQGAYSGNVKVYYEPTTDGDGQTITSSVLTASQTGGTNAEKISQTFAAIQGRNMPANFVIAAKWDGHWYALPANCTSSLSSTEGLLIEVNDMDNPTIATAAPASAKYGLREVIPSRQTDYGKGVVFTERFAEGDKQFALYNGSNANIQVDAQYSNYAASNPEKYEWIPSTSDFKDYTLTNASTGRNLGLTSGTFGAYTAASNQVRLLPATFYEPASVQVLKWKANSVIVMYTGAEATATTQVGDNAQSAEQTLAGQKLTHGIYELTTNQALTSNAGGTLSLYFGASTRVELEIPLIISGEVTASANAHDVVILENSKLTAATTKYSYKDVYVYGGGKLAIPDGTQLGVNNIILRAGGISTNGAGQEATYQYIYPQVELKGTLTSSVQNIRYEYVTDYDHWYHLVLPFDGSLASIHYPTEYYGDQVKLDNKGSWQIKRYAGEIRATGNYNAWVDIETEDKTSTTAGQGYIYWGAPKRITANDVYDRPTWGIQRITMSVSAPDAKTAENENKTIAGLGSYENVPNNSDKDNDQGWNLIGNPYMVNLNTMSEVGLKAGKLVEEKVDGKWTGKWINNGDNLRYLTIPSEHFDTYTAKTVSEAINANALVPGRAFFVQLEGEANGITFAADNRASLMPALLAENNDKPVDIETGIILSNETLQDEMNFWIKDGKTNDYEYNADYPKTPNNNRFNIYGVHTNGDLSWVAISPELAAESMPIGYQVPAAGTYMLSLSETYYSEDLESLYVTDHEMSPEVTVDLINAPYEFSVNQAETNNERFTISLKLKSEIQGPTTGWENIDVGKDHPTKFIHQDRLYILRDGVIYDATGQEIQTINK